MTDVQNLAAILNGRAYRDEMTKEEQRQAKAAGLVVVTGGSDDLVSFYGAIDDEAGASDGTRVHLSAEGLLKSKCDCSDCPYFEEVRQRAPFIDVAWGRDGWRYETKIPHATFDIFDEGELFSKGIVFRMADIAAGM